jgi:hypothetical protein
MRKRDLDALRRDFIAAMTQATSEFSKARIRADALLASLSRRGLLALAETEGKPLAEICEEQRQARARLRAASHKLEIGSTNPLPQPLSNCTRSPRGR